jgi:hypothetical protein
MMLEARLKLNQATKKQVGYRATSITYKVLLAWLQKYLLMKQLL